MALEHDLGHGCVRSDWEFVGSKKGTLIGSAQFELDGSPTCRTLPKGKRCVTFDGGGGVYVLKEAG